MSDFVYSRKKVEKGVLSEEIQKIYHDDKPPIQEFHGEWGSLAVSRNLYNGFQPYETNEHIFVVLGGPLLCFQINQVLGSNSLIDGTRAIYRRNLEGLIKWDEDLSGPFVILFINKITGEVACITDLMSFIPVYSYSSSENIMLSTHVDVLARASGQYKNIDVVSEVDFILHGIVTYPYTSYTNIRQIAPASEHRLNANNFELVSKNYWLPIEEYKYSSIKKAAQDLRKGIQDYVNNVVAGVSGVAHFISGGEDSRALSGILPKKCKRDAFIFLDYMNREGKVAKKAADAYGSNFNLSTRNKLHYLEILPACTDLVGKGAQYTHAHTFGFHKSCMLNEYPSVFGGLLADALLKGSHIKKLWVSERFPFFPQIKNKSFSQDRSIKSEVFQQDYLKELSKRKKEHLKYIQTFRKESAEEWFELWPSSMNMNIPNVHANRRLFRSYEPFMSKDVVKISAAVPQKWKLNRRLFNKAVRPFLKPTKWLIHGDGRLPYFPWYVNVWIQFIVWTYRQFGKRLGLIKGYQGPWAEWNAILKTQDWRNEIRKYSEGIDALWPALKEKDLQKLFNGNLLDRFQQVNLLQTLYTNCNRK